MAHGSSILPPPFSKRQIIEKADALIRPFVQSMPLRRFLEVGHSFDTVYEELIYPEYEICIEEHHDLGFRSLNEKILAEYLPEKRVVLVDKVIGPDSGDPRRCFTLWHEVLGHGVLQGDWFCRSIQRSRITTTSISLLPSVEVKVEQQANLFAAHCAAPIPLLKLAVRHVLSPSAELSFYEPCRYWLTANGVTRSRHVEDIDDVYMFIAQQIRHLFVGLSLQSLSIQLKAARIVVDKSERSFSMFAGAIDTFRLRRTSGTRVAQNVG